MLIWEVHAVSNNRLRRNGALSSSKVPRVKIQPEKFLDKNNLGQLLKLSMFELPFLWQTIQLETS
ncbi:hypothetical protein VCHA35O142_10844 [Vibrio chagasii]|nr:hypothetical protein VCHA28FP16_180021 [Vibrio chagasii]CAH6855073.1 hypothetical protein VCHA35O142_10844 [Vibrio chagasii]CAH6908974.1 hypothetical protein VCHA34P112_370022 [Vibrio chagasii]CAH7230845.1 hypothetical protein VCHA37O177_190021 [Vibrio chagasii]CAH7293537.1 hypothetical protein VCHA53O463_360022 [Vibrio chagasii]